MILTEKEAATKACVRSGGQGWAPGPMPDADTLPVWRCVGSRCMAWRQKDDGVLRAKVGTTIRKDDGTLEYLSRQMQNAPSDPGWEPMRRDEDGTMPGYMRSGTPRGYCGLVGTP